ncbi:MAG TPA: PQQ-binding-like beta-propeller repeat protein [Bacteroidota bacterium]|nr:PQQ-binding-like beta-propeller repeat protein [Bacteroidota bacterium]
MKTCPGIGTAICLWAALSLSGCAASRLPDPGPGQVQSWRMFGGDPDRRNASAARPVPPLVQQWETDAGAGFGPASPALSDSTIFVGTLTGEVRAVNLSTGDQTGSYDFGTAIFGTPLVFPGRMVVALSGDGENLVSYNLRTGAVQWSARTGPVESSLLAAGGGILAVGLDGSLTKFDTAKGDEVWKYSPADPSPSRSSPATDGARVIFGTDRGTVIAVDLATGRFAWEVRTGAAVFAAPAVYRGTAFIASTDGSVYAIGTGTGVIAWKRPLGSPLYGSPAVDDGRVFVGTSGAEVVALGSADGAVLWRTSVLGAVGSAPLVCGEYLYVGDLAKNLYALASPTGETVWQAETPGRVRCTPVAAPGRIIVLSEDRSIVGFREQR